MNSPNSDILARRALSRQLSECAADASGRTGFEPAPDPRPRIGITGSPGSGKSSLIGVLAAERVEAAGSLAVLAIDPTSPVSRGSILGDRVRMDQAAGRGDVFIRSLPSRSAADSLCDNTEALLRILERAAFGEIMLETVGAGQVQHTVRNLTDTLVMVMSPHAGDSIQAMKAGIMETADIYVVNKSDLPDARRTANDVRSTIAHRGREGERQPPVIMTCARSGEGVAELSAAIDDHRESAAASRDAAELLRKRAMHHAREVLLRRLDDGLSRLDGADMTDLSSMLDAAVRNFSRGF